MNKTILKMYVKDELNKQGKKATTKQIDEYINNLLSELLLTANAHIVNDVTNDEIVQ